MKSSQSIMPNSLFSLHKRGQILVLLMLTLSIFSFSSSVEAQTNPLRIRKTIVGNLTTVQTGQVFQYRITASCNNLTITCGDLTLTDTLPAGITFLGISGPIEPLPATASGIKYVYDDPVGSTVIMRNKRGAEVGAGDFTDGEIIEFIMTVRVDSSTPPGVLNNNLTGDVTQQDSGGDPAPVIHSAVPVTLLAPNPPAPNGSDWTYTKTQVIPVPPQQPTTDQPTLYQISVCPASNVGRTPHTSMTITDNYPVGANVLDADGGAVTPPQVLWTIPDAEVASAMENNTCIQRELLVEYPSPAFTGAINQTNAIVVDAAECTTTCGNSNVNFNIVAPNIEVNTSKNISGSPVGIGGTGRFFLNVNPNDGNVPAPNLVLSEDINDQPGELIRVTEIQSGRWEVPEALQPFVSVRARVEYDSSVGGTTILGTVDGLTNVVWTTLPAPPAYVDAVRWIFEYDPDGPGPDPFQPGLPLGFMMLEPPEIIFTPMLNPPFATEFTPGVYQNCAVATFTGGAGTASNCINYELGDNVVTGTNIGTTKSSPGGQTEFSPMQEFPLELRLRLSERARVGDTVVNPSIIDTLPAQLEFVSWDSVTFVNVTGPIPFFRQTGSTLQWYWANAPLAGSLQPAPAGLPNTVTATGSRAFTMTADGQNQDVIVRFTVRISPSISDNINDPTPYSNAGYFIGPGNPICEDGTVGTEASFGIDDGDGIPENACRTTFEFRVRKALALEGFKWIRNPNYAANPPRFPEFAIHTDNTVAYDTSNPTTGQACTNPVNYFEFPTGSSNFWTRFPCVAFGFPENPITALPPTGAFTTAAPNDDQFEYLLDVRNVGNVVGQDYYLYDVLPHVGDTGSGGPLSESPRLSRFATYLTGPVTPAGFTGVTNPGNIIIEYSQAANSCRTEVFDDPPQGGCTDDWTPVFPTANPRSVTAYRIRFAVNMQIAVGGRMLFRVPMVIAYNAQYGNAQIAWNSFAHTAINSENVAGGFLPPAEPRKVGIRVPERLSIGNRVWRDSDNSGTINAPDDTTPGIAGVVVNLYADFNGDGVPDGPAIDTDTTDANGYYLFDDIIPDANPNNNRYIVGIPASNFATVAAPLYNLRSSTGPISTTPYNNPPENNAESDDNGINPAVPGQEVLSATINLSLYNERTNETDLSANPADGAFSRGTRGEANNNSDLSIDFGFFGGGDTPFSIGNRVWYDDGNDGVGGFNAAQRNNGIQDAGELGVNGVRVELYRDGNGNNSPDPAEFIRFDITAAGAAGSGRPGADLNGYYLFDNLDAGTYFVIIPASEFGTNDPLGGWHSSTFNGTETLGAIGATGTPATDLDDNGVEPASRRPDLNGVASGAIVFVRVAPGDPGLEVTGELDLSREPDPGAPNNDPTYNGAGDIGPTGWDGPNSIGRWAAGTMTDDSSNIAVDFGFIPPMSIGNRVWLDDSSDPAQWLTGGSRNNALIDATDDGNLTTAGIQNPGIAGVTLQLYADENNNSTIDAGDTLVNTTTTAANGYYLFDGLAAGNYLIRIPSTNFGAGQPLNGLISSLDTVAQVNPTNQIDNNDNGIDNAAPATNGIVSRQIQLIYQSEATGETDLAPAGTTTTLPGPQSRGRFGEADNDSDLTIDFGFVRPPMSIGNQVWLDDHPTNQALRNNGLFDAGETVIAGVEVALYRDLDADGVVDAGEDTGFRDTTDANGFYLFSHLPPGSYIVAITAANFNTGGPLENMISSRSVAPNPLAADNQTDNNDNGVDTFVAGVGVISSRIVLTYGAEPTTETPVNDPADGVGGRGTHGERNQDSDLTVDFGFYVPMSLGNRVWLDDTDTPANWNTTRNNAVLDFVADDLDNPNIAGVQGLGVAGVTLRLYRDLDADGVIDAGEDTGRTTTTNATGYYLFDGLPRGNYMVGVEASNFTALQPLFGFYSSTNAVAPTDNNTDNTDDGTGITATPTIPDPTFGIISPSILLSYTNATTGLEPLDVVETDPAPQTQANRGANGELDAFSNLTIDFGFVRPPMSIGNQVWLDDHPTNQTLRNNGIFDAGENAIAGVEVALYRDANTNGIVDAGEDTGFRDTTDANGFYLFSNLSPGNYIVAITAANFNTGGPLENMISSRSVAPNPLAADNQTDNNDNGVDTFVAGVGIISNTINLTVGAEPTAEIPVNTPADGPNGRGTNGELDNNSDLTVDFGFYVPMSLGNRVWLDDSDNPANWSIARDNAVLDFANDDLDNPNIAGVQGLGVAGVTLRLYNDLDADGVIDAGEDSGRTTTTNATGYYLFDGLTRGNYIVGVEASNFTAGQPLNGFYSSTNVVAPTDNNTDNTDDGRGAVGTPNVPDPTFGIISPSILLSYTNATTGLEPLDVVETDPTPQTQANRGANGELDAFSNLTIDFGFARPPMSIGNRVWFDGNNNGLIDTVGTTDDYVQGGAVAPGIPGVTVRLFLDADANGVPDSPTPVVPDVVTDANGHYLFVNVPPGNYVVALPNANFTAGQPLAGLISSTGNSGDNQVDSDDNGIDLLDATYGLLSPSITLSPTTEPVGETDLSAAGNGAGIDDNNGEMTIDFGLYLPMSIGNRLWFDTNANSLLDGGESGVPAGVPLGLYRDDNNDDVPDGPAIVTTTTDANGYYLFDGLGIGRYIVIVEQAAFQPGGILQNYISSTGEDTTDNTDQNDNGVNNPTPAVGGIRSNVITLAVNNAPTTETDLGPGGNGSNGETNNNSNLTVDFGFVNAVELSLGNLVWIDNGGTGSGTARDGIRNGDELPVANVVVNLYLDLDSNGIPDDLGAPGPADDIVDTDTTDANGHYLFDALSAGNYIVELAASNFAVGAVLDGYGSTLTATVPDLNNNDYGIDTPDTLTGIRSGTVVLAVNSEPTGDTDPVNTKGYGASNIDPNGNMTVDFGVYRPMSIGNRVWFDTNENGTINPGEPGIAGVTVELRVDTNNNGTFEPLTDLLVTTPGVTATDVTDVNGYYLFSNLLPGTYFVYIPPSEFAGVLAGYESTTDNVGGIAADNNDNGVSDGGTGIVSNPVTLTENNAPTNETDFSNNAAVDGPRFIGLNGENNSNSNVSIDFGFTSVTTPMSLGNRVWSDNNNNGLIDAGDDYDTATAGDQPGVPGVVVNLYVDSNSDGVPDGAILRTDTTDANGYYLFGNLPPGNYVVQIAPVNFQTGGVLRGLFSSTGVNNDQITDINDNGIDNPNPASTGVLSATISLVPAAMPLGETDLSGNPADGPDSRGTNSETDANSNLTIDFGFTRRFDWGDAPDSYGTTNGAGGPSHAVISTIFMGNIEDTEADGQPSPAADGDDTNNSNNLGDDEDGVTIPVAVAGTNLNVEVRVFNNTGSPAVVTGWIDFNGNGTFEPAEAATINVPSSPVAYNVTLVFAVPATADVDTGGQTYGRFRLTTDPTITTSTPGGLASNGEVEDYLITINPPGVSVTKNDGANAIVVGQTTTYTITIQYSGLAGITRIVNDTTNPANAFDPATITWTCDANGQASCVTGQPLGTDIATDTDAVTPPVAGLITAQSIDLEQGGQIVYSLTGTLIADYNTVFPGVPNIVNTVSLDSGETATDTNGVIFDPPFGIKTGTVLNDTTIRWTMVWFNTRLMQAATITDLLDPSQTNPTNLSCTPYGTTSTNRCEILGGNTILWEGIMGDGTDPTDRANNRLEITFEVTVSGTGSYSNAATITTAGGDTFPTNATVVIGSGAVTPVPGGGTGGATNGAGDALKPTITKTVDQEFSSRGGTVTWTIQVINPHNQPISSVAVNDTMPADLEILSTSTTNGTVTVVGQFITVNIPTLNPLETVTITVTTRVSKNTTATEFANFADLFTAQNGKIDTAGAMFKMVGALPATGEVPLQREIARALLLTLAPALVVGGISLVVYRRRMAHR